jgi:hypothetical protein
MNNSLILTAKLPRWRLPQRSPSHISGPSPSQSKLDGFVNYACCMPSAELVEETSRLIVTELS